MVLGISRQTELTPWSPQFANDRLFRDYWTAGVYADSYFYEESSESEDTLISTDVITLKASRELFITLISLYISKNQSSATETPQMFLTIDYN